MDPAGFHHPAANEFNLVNDFLDTYESSGGDQRLVELTAITPRSFSTPTAVFGTPATAFAAAFGGALDRKGSVGAADLYSPGGTYAGSKADKPTPLRQANLPALETLDGAAAAAAAAAAASAGTSNGAGMTGMGARTLSANAEDVSAVQGASSLLSLRASGPAPVQNANTHERFLLTAADPVDADDDEARLLVVLQAKYEAGLIKPYDYGAAYARFQRFIENKYEAGGHAPWMRAVGDTRRPGSAGQTLTRTLPVWAPVRGECRNRSMSAVNRQRVQSALSTFRPAFQAIAQSLTDIEVIRVEESFERLLLVRDAPRRHRPA